MLKTGTPADRSPENCDYDDDDIEDADLKLLMLRKPTALHKIIVRIPRPARAVPKNGLPIWYKIGLEQKLPVPDMPKGRILFSRGKVGENIRKSSVGGQPTFDLTDPYCHLVKYTYDPVHDPHLAPYFRGKKVNRWMKKLGYVTKDNQAICSLKDFNLFRNFLYNRFMDRIHHELAKKDELDRDHLHMFHVERDVARRKKIFNKMEKQREHFEKVFRERAEEMEAKMLMDKEKEMKTEARLERLKVFKETQAKERAKRAKEKEKTIKQRVLAAAELELRRKITMLKTWRINENRRLARMKKLEEEKRQAKENKTEHQWQERIRQQNEKIEETAKLLQMYEEDMATGVMRRHMKSERRAYNRELELYRIQLRNWKTKHETPRVSKLMKSIAQIYEKSQRGPTALPKAQAHAIAKIAFTNINAGVGLTADPLSVIEQTRIRMAEEIAVPAPVSSIMKEVLEATILEFARRRVAKMLRHVEDEVLLQALTLFSSSPHTVRTRLPSAPKRTSRAGSVPRFSMLQTKEIAHNAISFGENKTIVQELQDDARLKSIKDRPPTPVPSPTELVEAVFTEEPEAPVAADAEGAEGAAGAGGKASPGFGDFNLTERRKLLDMVDLAAKLISKGVSGRVGKGVDVASRKVTLPRGMRVDIDRGESIEGLAHAAVDMSVSSSSPAVRQSIDYLTRYILIILIKRLKEQKEREATMRKQRSNQSRDFYNPVEFGDHND